MVNANSHFGTLRYPLIMYTKLFHYVEQQVELVLSFTHENIFEPIFIPHHHSVSCHSETT